MCANVIRIRRGLDEYAVSTITIDADGNCYWFIQIPIPVRIVSRKQVMDGPLILGRYGMNVKPC